MLSQPAAAPIATSENSATRITLAHTISRRRSKRSTITPAGSPITSHGRKTAKVVSASSRGSSVSVSASSGMATKLIPSPSWRSRWPSIAASRPAAAVAERPRRSSAGPSRWRHWLCSPAGAPWSDTPARYTDFEANSERFTLLSVVRGTSSTITTRRGALNAARRSLTSARSSVEASVDARRSTGTTYAVTSWPHSSSGVPPTATSATSGCSRRIASTGSGHTFSPPVMIRSPLRPCDADESVVVDRSEITGREPAVRCARVGAIAVAAQQHRAAQLQLAVHDSDLDAVERAPSRSRSPSGSASSCSGAGSSTRS